MPVRGKRRSGARLLEQPRRKQKFQADLAPGDDRAVRGVAPEIGLPRVEIAWTERELASLARLASLAEAAEPTDAPIRAMRD